MRIRVVTAARLHLGFYNFRRGDRVYGSIGIAIDRPALDIVLEPCDHMVVEKPPDLEIGDVLKTVQRVFRRWAKVSIRSAIPRHVGLGSTTQLALALGIGLASMSEPYADIDIYDLAAKLGRGFVSGIGVAAFRYGGFIVDSGRKLRGSALKIPSSPEDVPQPIALYAVPHDWRFVIIVPRTERRCIREEEEHKVMQPPPSISGELQHELYATLLLDMLPAIRRGDIETFGRALTKIQLLTGKFFESIQGGLFCCRETEAIVRVLNELGVYGYGQSSWGPVAYGLTDVDSAEKILHRSLERLKELNISIEYASIASPRNRGAEIYTE